MTLVMKIFTCLFVFLFPLSAFCQILTGTWEGSGGGTTFIRLVVKHRGDSLFGYTYDEGGGYCKATFIGRYSKSGKRLVGRGKEMIENSGTHVLTEYDLVYSKEPGGEYLRENVGQSGFLERLLGGDSRQYLKKISNRISPPVAKTSKPPVSAPRAPANVGKAVPLKKSPVITPKVQPKKEVVKKPVTVPSKTVVVSKPNTAVVSKTPKPITKPPVATKVARDTVVKKVVAAPPKVVVKTAPAALIRKKDERTSKLVETIYTTADSVKMFVYDNGEVDGDTVTVFINNALVLDRYRISEKAKEISFPVTNNGGVHTIELFANNLGSIPPNTALIILIAGKERFELRASYDLSTNAKIIIRHQE